MSARPAPAEIAAARLARLPWRRLAPGEGAPPALERGWVGGLREAAEVLEEIAGATARRGRGFGGTVPWVPTGGAVIGWGLPVAVGTTEVQGPDGAYQLQEASVMREAAGRTDEVVRLADDPIEGGGPDFELLWFGVSERYLVRRGRVEVEDLFARVVAPVDVEWLERNLVRRSRIDGGILDGLTLTPAQGAATIEVRRPEALSAAGWKEPELLLAVREGIRRVEGGSRWLHIVLEDGAELEVATSVTPDGWVAHFDGGKLPWRRLWCRSEAGAVVYGAEPVADPRDPAVRTRWAFDLTSDLVKLGGG